MHETPVSWGMHCWGGWGGDWIKLLVGKTEWASAGLNPYGNLSNAALCVEGMLLSVFVIGKDDPYLYDITPDHLRETPPGEEPPAFVKVGKLIFDEDKSLDGLRDGEMGGAIVNLMQFISNKDGGDSGGYKWHVTGLVLVKTGLGYGRFRRVGLGLVRDLDYFHHVDRREIVIV